MAGLRNLFVSPDDKDNFIKYREDLCDLGVKLLNDTHVHPTELIPSVLLCCVAMYRILSNK